MCIALSPNRTDKFPTEQRVGYPTQPKNITTIATVVTFDHMSIIDHLSYFDLVVIFDHLIANDPHLTAT